MSNERKSKEKKVGCPCCGYLCCAFSMVLIALSIVYWYITIPIIAILIVGYIFVSHQNRIKVCNSLDTIEKHEEFIKETGNYPIDKGKFTSTYKAWLIKKENERKASLQQQTTQAQPTHQPQPAYQSEPTLQPQPVHEPKPSYPPATRQVIGIEKTISAKIRPKDFKVKFKDYTANEKAIRLIFDFIAAIILISFIIFAILSFVQQQYMRGIISIIVMMICLIPNEIVEHKLRNKARIRKMNEFIEMKTQREQYYQPKKVYQQEPIHRQEPTYQPVPKQEIEKVFCPLCGGENKKKDHFCKNCGSKLD